MVLFLRFKYLFFILVLCLLAGYPLLHPGLHPTHDGEYHVIRFYEFDKTLRDGDWYPRWAPDLNNGYGVPLFNYVYPLPNYIASFFHIFGVSFIDAFKLNMFLALVIGAVFFYLWTRMFWGNLGGVVSAIFYTYAPYHFVDIYIRGSVGEVWALAFFPAFLWCITGFFQKKKAVFAVFSGVFLSLIIFSHNILALMFMPFSLSYIGIFIYRRGDRKYLLLNTLYIILLGFGLSAVFWFPALSEIQYVTGLQIYDIKNSFPEFYQLLIPSWGSGFSGGTLEGQMSFQIGVANLLVIIASMGSIVVFLRKKDRYNFRIIIFFFSWFTFVIFLMLKVSLPIWQYVPFMDYFQFPWRFLSLAILISSFLAGSITTIFNNSKIGAIGFVLFAVMVSIGYAKPAYYHNRNDLYYITRSNFIDGTNSPGDLFNTIWFNRELKKQSEKATIVHGKIIEATIRPTMYMLTLFLESESSITVNTAYFPGWEAFVDKKEVKVMSNRNGLISFLAPAGIHLIEVQFKDTPVRRFGAFLSIASFFSIFFYSFLKLRGII